MTHIVDEEDEVAYGHESPRRKGMKWTKSKIAFCIFLFTASILLMLTGIYPLLDMDYDLKNFSNLLFVSLHGFYLFGFGKVKRKKDFVFWSASFLVLDLVTFLFYFYEDIYF
ncbi:hypothetical protein COBT_003014 [Conglomerata obtusa]